MSDVGFNCFLSTKGNHAFDVTTTCMGLACINSLLLPPVKLTSIHSLS